LRGLHRQCRNSVKSRQGRYIPRAGHDLDALGNQFVYDRATDTAARARDDRDPTFKLEFHAPIVTAELVWSRRLVASVRVRKRAPEGGRARIRT
jgi:hypothetical protein